MSLSDSQRATLRLFCDTVVPRIERDPDPLGFWARTASDLGVPEAVEGMIATLDDELRSGLCQLLDAIDAQLEDPSLYERDPKGVTQPFQAAPIP